MVWNQGIGFKCHVESSDTFFQPFSLVGTQNLLFVPLFGFINFSFKVNGTLENTCVFWMDGEETSYILEPVTTYQNGASAYWAHSIDKCVLSSIPSTQVCRTRVPVLRPASWMNTHFRTWGTVIKSSAMRRLDGEQRTQWETCLVHAPSIHGVCFVDAVSFWPTTTISN